MIKLSISIVHYSKQSIRIEWIKEIKNIISPHLNLLNGFDIYDDIENLGPVENYKRCWSNIPSDSTHHLVLEDDMMPCNNFVPAVIKILELKPDNMIHLFSKNDAIYQSLSHNKHWYVTPDGISGGSAILPQRHFKWYNWIEEHCEDKFQFVNNKIIFGDTKLNYYALYNKEIIWNIAPSLLEHVGYNISSVGNKTGEFRKSKFYIDKNDPLLIDWSLGVDDPVRGMPTWPGIRVGAYYNLKEKYRKEYYENIISWNND